MVSRAGIPRARREAGGMYMAVLILLIVGAVALMAVAPAWSGVIRRDKEEELIFRGGQYVLAIREYRADHGGAWPTDLRQLLELGPKQRRYIRRLFREPMNPSGEWGLLTEAMASQINNPVVGQPANPDQPGFGGTAPGQPQDVVSDMFDEEGFRGPATGGAVGPILGVYSIVDREGFRKYNGKERYREWIFSAVEQNQQNPQQPGQPTDPRNPPPGQP